MLTNLYKCILIATVNWRDDMSKTTLLMLRSILLAIAIAIAIIIALNLWGPEINFGPYRYL